MNCELQFVSRRHCEREAKKLAPANVLNLSVLYRLCSIVLFSAACSATPYSPACHDDASQCAIDHFEVVVSAYTPGGAHVSDECRQVVESVQFVTVNEADMQGVCGSNNDAVIGCVPKEGAAGVVYLADSELGQRVEIAVHELLHVLLRCEAGDVDAGHKWTGFRGPFDTAAR